MQETLVQSLGREDCLEEEMAIHSSILASRIPRTEETGGVQSLGSLKEPDITEAILPTHESDMFPLYHFHKSYFNNKLRLNFIRCFFLHLWRSSCGFGLFFPFCGIVHQLVSVCWTTEPSLWTRDESHWVTVYDHFVVLLDLVSSYFLENLCLCFHQRYWPVIFYFGTVFVLFWYQGDGGFIKWLWDCSLLYIL